MILDCSVLGCENPIKPHHLFPKASSEPERFKAWLAACGNPKLYSIKAQRNVSLFNYVCHKHFDTKHMKSDGKLTADAVPTLLLPSESKVDKKNTPLNSKLAEELVDNTIEQVISSSPNNNELFEKVVDDTNIELEITDSEIEKTIRGEMVVDFDSLMIPSEIDSLADSMLQTDNGSNALVQISPTKELNEDAITLSKNHVLVEVDDSSGSPYYALLEIGGDGEAVSLLKTTDIVPLDDVDCGDLGKDTNLALQNLVKTLNIDEEVSSTVDNNVPEESSFQKNKCQPLTTTNKKDLEVTKRFQDNKQPFKSRLEPKPPKPLFKPVVTNTPKISPKKLHLALQNITVAKGPQHRSPHQVVIAAKTSNDKTQHRPIQEVVPKTSKNKTQQSLPQEVVPNTSKDKTQHISPQEGVAPKTPKDKPLGEMRALKDRPKKAKILKGKIQPPMTQTSRWAPVGAFTPTNAKVLPTPVLKYPPIVTSDITNRVTASMPSIATAGLPSSIASSIPSQVTAGVPSKVTSVNPTVQLLAGKSKVVEETEAFKKLDPLTTVPVSVSTLPNTKFPKNVITMPSTSKPSVEKGSVKQLKSEKVKEKNYAEYKEYFLRRRAAEKPLSYCMIMFDRPNEYWEKEYEIERLHFKKVELDGKLYGEIIQDLIPQEGIFSDLHPPSPEDKSEHRESGKKVEQPLGNNADIRKTLEKVKSSIHFRKIDEEADIELLTPSKCYKKVDNPSTAHARSIPTKVLQVPVAKNIDSSVIKNLFIKSNLPQKGKVIVVNSSTLYDPKNMDLKNVVTGNFEKIKTKPLGETISNVRCTAKIEDITFQSIEDDVCSIYDEKDVIDVDSDDSFELPIDFNEPPDLYIPPENVVVLPHNSSLVVQGATSSDKGNFHENKEPTKSSRLTSNHPISVPHINPILTKVPISTKGPIATKSHTYTKGGPSTKKNIESETLSYVYVEVRSKKDGTKHEFQIHAKKPYNWKTIMSDIKKVMLYKHKANKGLKLDGKYEMKYGLLAPKTRTPLHNYFMFKEKGKDDTWKVVAPDPAEHDSIEVSPDSINDVLFIHNYAALTQRQRRTLKYAKMKEQNIKIPNKKVKNNFVKIHQQNAAMLEKYDKKGLIPPKHHYPIVLLKKLEFKDPQRKSSTKYSCTENNRLNISKPLGRKVLKKAIEGCIFETSGNSHFEVYNDLDSGNNRIPIQAKYVLCSWIKQHSDNPCPDDNTIQLLAAETGLTVSQVNNWFNSARKRLVDSCNYNQHSVANRKENTAVNALNQIKAQEKETDVNTKMKWRRKVYSKSRTSLRKQTLTKEILPVSEGKETPLNIQSMTSESEESENRIVSKKPPVRPRKEVATTSRAQNTTSNVEADNENLGDNGPKKRRRKKMRKHLFSRVKASQRKQSLLKGNLTSSQRTDLYRRGGILRKYCNTGRTNKKKGNSKEKEKCPVNEKRNVSVSSKEKMNRLTSSKEINTVHQQANVKRGREKVTPNKGLCKSKVDCLCNIHCNKETAQISNKKVCKSVAAEVHGSRQCSDNELHTVFSVTTHLTDYKDQEQLKGLFELLVKSVNKLKSSPTDNTEAELVVKLVQSSEQTSGNADSSPVTITYESNFQEPRNEISRPNSLSPRTSPSKPSKTRFLSHFNLTKSEEAPSSSENVTGDLFEKDHCSVLSEYSGTSDDPTETATSGFKINSVRSYSLRAPFQRKKRCNSPTFEFYGNKKKRRKIEPAEKTIQSPKPILKKPASVQIVHPEKSSSASPENSDCETVTASEEGSYLPHLDEIEIEIDGIWQNDQKECELSTTFSQVPTNNISEEIHSLTQDEKKSSTS